MGSPVGEPKRGGNEFQHRVTVSSFYLAKYEVSQAEYQELMGNNPSFFTGPELPVEQISWFDAIKYCNRLSEKEGLSPAYTIEGNSVTWDRSANGYRLPTEAEWEYACRAGTTTPFYTGADITGAQANFNGSRPYKNSAPSEYRQTTIKPGSFDPNPFGIYDMHGNVGEWCWDWNAEYAAGEQADPAGSNTGSYRVFRGGSWNHSADFLRSACRGGNRPAASGFYLGFRLARNADLDSE